MYSKTCAGCGNEFETENFKQVRCGRNCGRKASELDLKRRKVAREAEQAAHDLEFIGIDGEGVNITRRTRRIDPDTLLPVRDDRGRFIMDEETVQKYVLIGCGDQSYYAKDEFGNPTNRELTHDEILTFLYEQFEEHPKAVFVGFSLRYDFNFWLKSMPETTAWKLLTQKGRDSRKKRLDSGYDFIRPALDGGKFTYWSDEDCNFVRGYVTPNWEIQMLGMKSFQFRPYVPWEQREIRYTRQADGSLKETRVGKPYMHVCDAFAFFQQSLEAVIEGVLKDPNQTIITPAEHAIITHGKQELRTTSTHITPELIRYNITENLILARRMAELNRGFVQDGIKLSRKQWYGPGQAAQAWLKLIEFPTSDAVQEVVPRWALEAARDSYYGGWFEIFNHGPIAGTTYNYDINSAYPAVIAKLPCLLHGKWKHTKAVPKNRTDRTRCLVKADIRGSDKWIGAAMHRTHEDSILRPRRTIGWHWLHELEMGQRAGLVDSIKVMECVTYEPCYCPSPGAPIAELYEGRVALGKAGKNGPAGIAKKLVYNSAYGKCAQSIGTPKFANPIYASLITAGCRTQILEAIATHPRRSAAVLMIATDGIVFKDPHPTLPTSDTKLGMWEETTYEDLSLFMPGIYWHNESRKMIAAGKSPKLKSRGVSAKDLKQIVATVDRLWEEKVREPWRPVPTVTVKVGFAQISASQAVQRDEWDTCARVIFDGSRELNAEPQAKRQGLSRSASAMVGVPDGLRSYPYADATQVPGANVERGVETYYYSRGFGLEEDDVLALGAAMPIDEMDTPDGPVALSFTALKGE